MACGLRRRVPLAIVRDMQQPGRRAWAFLILVMGAIAYVSLGGSPVGRCLGPLGVTGVECAAAGGYAPTVGSGFAMLAATVTGATLILLVRGVRALALTFVFGLGGAVAAALAYLALRPQTWTGATSTGAVITIPMPFDGWALTAAAILGVAGGAVVGVLIPRSGAGDRSGPHGIA